MKLKLASNWLRSSYVKWKCLKWELNPTKHSSWWRCLEDVFRLCLQKTSSRHLQDVLIKTNIFALAIHLQKTSSRCLGQDQYVCFDHTSSRHFQEIFKTSCQDVFKMFSGRLAKMSSRHHQIKLFLLTSLQDLFKTIPKHAAKTVIYRRICLGHTSEKFMVSVQNLQEW